MTISGVPSQISYIREFISADEEAQLLEKVATAPLPKWVTVSGRRLQNWGATPVDNAGTALASALPPWLETLALRIAAVSVCESESGHVSERTVSGRVSERGGSESELESESERGAGRLLAAAPNHCLVNEYLPGQGILPHVDGPAYRPAVATVSLGQHAVLDLYKRRPLDHPQAQTPDFRVLLQPRSLVVLQDELYTGYMHGIAPVTQDVVSRATIANWREAGFDETHDDDEERVLVRSHARVSLTFREAAKVSKLNLFGKRRR
ncbi:hypothetical protein HK100_005354 [Physocladia obscura]|uniref:Fe2OG dioxygenase domain-containing protein n=1 Tax=Physocladia obscura TaxID=109957 RepID=A0AAD5X9E5_9FUNG|nr:hypothetical protein HK100_005354 [Physocladia obscura]